MNTCLLSKLMLAAILTLPFSVSAISVGDTAPSFKARTIDGKKSVALEDYRGKVVLLDFWASWCPPCLKSLPLYDDLRRELGTTDFEIVAINVDENTDDARKFLQKHPVSYPIAKDPKGVLPGVFGVKAMPTSYLIDKNGVVQHVHAAFKDGDVAKIKAEIEKLIAQ
ncbi:MAG: TlpA disulfide reductase family protein [Gammaproteobacteria bacterium]|nr:TlpA disulfide reductase family protein [Gammaproteobacteria bacterium]